MEQNNYTLRAIIGLSAAAVLAASCSSLPAGTAWRSTGSELPRGLAVEIGSEAGGLASFTIRGGELEGATVSGEARRDGEGWALEARSLDWFGNWAEGWTECRFAMEGELSLRPEGSGWALAAVSAPRIEAPLSASMRQNGEYYAGDEALAFFSRRWDRIQAVDELLREKFPDAWYDYSAPPRFRAIARLFRRGVADFQTELGSFLFPELYGYPSGSAPVDRRDLVLGESIRWNSAYTRANFPEALRSIRDSGSMQRDFEEGAGLMRLDFAWENLWGLRLESVSFEREQRKKP
jgi:hypothetical protein